MYSLWALPTLLFCYSSFDKIVDSRNSIVNSFSVVSPIKNCFIINHNPLNISVAEIGLDQASTNEINVFQNSSLKIGSCQVRFGQGDITQISSFKNSTSHLGITDTGISEIGISKIGIFSSNAIQVSSTEVSSTQVSPTQVGQAEFGLSEVSSAQVNPTQVNPLQIQHTEISIPSSITSQQLFSSNLSHNSSPNLLTDIYNTAQTLWHTITPIDLAFKIQDLPTRQLAEATITGYDNLGRPNTATITIDHDANGVGWFVDSTPQDNSEFQGVGVYGSGGVGEYFQATPNSTAYGKYDLLTTILHEMGHTLGIINGYSEFNKYVKGRQFITDTFTANLTPDGSHLDTSFHPYDLMNTSLKTGVRKLPSALNLAMIDAINAGVGGWVSGVGINSAHLTAGALIGINNGDFNTAADWNTLGATNIINGTATLTEQSQKLSELTQAFIIPTGAKTLQFTIKDNHLVGELAVTTVTGVGGNKAPGDAFEVALLDSNTFNPLAGTIGLTHSDALLNIQANGTIHKSDKVTITALGNNSSIITIDLTQVTPTTQATLYFNLLGFASQRFANGARTSTVTIDDVKLFTDTQPIPVTNNDTLITNQNTPLTLDPTQLTTNDTNVTQIQIINQPTHGKLTQTPDGKFTYQPVSTYVGNNSFTYLGFGTDGQISNLATVKIAVDNVAPTATITTPNTTINQGEALNLGVTGIKDTHIITWNFGDGSDPITLMGALGFAGFNPTYSPMYLLHELSRLGEGEGEGDGEKEL